MAERTYEEFAEYQQNVLNAIQDKFSYLVSEFNFHVEKVEAENSWCIVWYENANKSRKVSINFDRKDLYINQYTYQREEDGLYTEIHITDMLKQFGLDPKFQDPNQLYEMLSVGYIDEESENEFYLRVAEKMTLWAAIYREAADKILKGDKYIPSKDTTPFWKQWLGID